MRIGLLLTLSLPAMLHAAAPSPWATPAELRALPFKARHENVRHLDFSPCGTRLVTTGGNQVMLWDCKVGKLLARHSKGLVFTRHGVHTGDGKRIAVLAASAGSFCVKVYDATNLDLLGEVGLGKVFLHEMASIPGTSRVVVARKNSVAIVDVQTLRIAREIRFDDDFSPRYPKVSPDGSQFVCGHGDHTPPDLRTVVRWIDLNTGKKVHDWRTAIPEKELLPTPHVLAFSRAEGLFAVGKDCDDLVTLCDPARPDLMRRFNWNRRLYKDEEPHPNRGVANLCFAPDGKTLMVISFDRFMRSWETATGQLRYKSTMQCDNMALSPDGRILATSDQLAGVVRLWNWRDLGSHQLAATEADMPDLWRRLGSTNGVVAYRGVTALIAAPREAVALLKKRVRRTEPVDAALLARLTNDLSSEEFAVRDAAEKALNGHGRVAESALRKMLESKPAPEARRRAERLLRPLDTLSTEEVRDLRAVEVLEAIATPEAIALLRHWAEGADGTTLTRHARAARDRLNTR